MMFPTSEPVPASGRFSASTEIALAGVRPQTNIAIVDAVLYGNSTYIVDVLKHAVLPALALGLLTAGVFLRLVRVNMLQTLRAGYVDAARARGEQGKATLGDRGFGGGFGEIRPADATVPFGIGVEGDIEDHEPGPS